MRARTILRLLLAAAATAALAGFAEEPAATDPLAALNEGNRLYRNGQLEAAVEAYRAGYSPAAPNLTLAYNLGTALHHLGRLPEAILWYRRAGDSADPWLAENLALAHRTLGTRALPPGGLTGVLAPRADVLRWLAVLGAWGAAVAVVARRKLTLWAAAAAVSASPSQRSSALSAARLFARVKPTSFPAAADGISARANKAARRTCASESCNS